MRACSRSWPRWASARCRSYKGAQIFEALGLHPDVVRAAFVGTPSRVAGVSFPTLAADALAMHGAAYSGAPHNAARALAERGRDGPLLILRVAWLLGRGGRMRAWARCRCFYSAWWRVGLGQG